MKFETLFKVKPSHQVLTVRDILKAHHLSMPVGAFLARTDRLMRQVREVKISMSSRQNRIIREGKA